MNTESGAYNWPLFIRKHAEMIIITEIRYKLCYYKRLFLVRNNNKFGENKQNGMDVGIQKPNNLFDQLQKLL